jgi:hypothetical protein
MRSILSLIGAAMALPAVAQAQDAPLTWTVTGEEAPQVQPWTQPASLSYVDSSEDGEDRTQLSLALKVAGQFDGSANTWFLRGVAQVSDRAQKEQEAYSVQLGVHLEPHLISTRDGLPDPDQLSVFTDVSVGYNSKAVFGAPDSAACVANPGLPACGTQHERSVRLSVDLQPHLAAWEQAYGLITVDGQTRTSDDWAWSFAPRLVVFYDEVTDAVVDATGRRAEGGVAGVKWSAAIAVSPPIFDHRLLFRASWQHIAGLDVASARELTFDDDTSLVTASLDWELGVRAFDNGGKPRGWAPSIGVSWSDGDDALTGRVDKDDVTVAFRLTYRGG